MAIQSVNPATGETIQCYDVLSDDELDAKLACAAEAFAAYRRTTYEERAGWLARAGEILDGEKDAFGRLMTTEMGKPLRAAVAEAEKCAWVCRYYAEHGGRFLADEVVATDAERSWIRYDPIGPVLAVMPWNFPFWQVFRFAAPALMLGNVGLLKHASNVPGCALAIEEILRRAGFPEGVFQALMIEVPQVERVLDDPRVRAATLTGSERAGSSVAERAGKRIKKTVLELGGSDPFLVLPSADLETAIATAVQARTINNGQSCIAAKRFIVHEQVYDAFVQGFVERMQALEVGDPMHASTDVGPLATAGIRDGVHDQVERSVAAGARLLCGGAPLDGPGYYYPPTVLVDLPEGAPARVEEVFGPVAAVIRVGDLDEAIEVANETEFGLGSSAWTNDAAEQERLVAELDAGLVFFNAMVAADPRLPCGGVKNSGYGRELGAHGAWEFANLKTVWIGGEGAHRRETE